MGFQVAKVHSLHPFPVFLCVWWKVMMQSRMGHANSNLVLNTPKNWRAEYHFFAVRLINKEAKRVVRVDGILTTKVWKWKPACVWLYAGGMELGQKGRVILTVKDNRTIQTKIPNTALSLLYTFLNQRTRFISESVNIHSKYT